MYAMEDKLVVINGIGGQDSIMAGVARSFAKNGANLFLVGQSKKKLSIYKKLEKEFGIQVITHQINYDEFEFENAVICAVQAISNEFGHLDVLLNCSQFAKSGTLLQDTNSKDFEHTIHSGLYAYFFWMKHAYPLLKINGGSVINFASGAALFGEAGQASYAASKEAIRALSRVAATEWGPDQINVNVVCPLVENSVFRRWKNEYPAVYETFLDSIPLHRLGNSEKDLGTLCIFLASDDAKYISGETICQQGGLGLRP